MIFVSRTELRSQHERAGSPPLVGGIDLKTEYLPRTYRNGNVVGIEMQRGGVRFILNAGGEFFKSKSSDGFVRFVKMDDVTKAGFCQLVREQMVANRLFCEELVIDPRFSNICAALFPERS